jgi:hypothetical protein
MGIEDPEADVAEQLRPASPVEEDDDRVTDPDGLPAEADPADVADQRTVVPEDDDWDRG